MDMYNLDGSRGAMCGNGIRCVGKYAYDHHIVDKPQIFVETLSGIKYLDMKVENGKVTAVTVDMGESGADFRASGEDRGRWNGVRIYRNFHGKSARRSVYG